MAQNIEQAERIDAPSVNLNSDETVKITKVTPKKRPSWPPPPRPRLRRSRISIGPQVSASALALLLVISGLVFIIYSATVDYHGALRAVATGEARATQNIVSTAQTQQQATTQALNTVQAHINATATTQTIHST